LRIDKGRPTQIVTVEREIVEGIELDFIVMLPGMQRIGVGDTIDAEHHRLTINDELLVPVLQRTLDNPRIALGPVVAAMSDQANAITVMFQPQPGAIVLISWSQSGLLGTVVALVGRQKSNIKVQTFALYSCRRFSSSALMPVSGLVVRCSLTTLPLRFSPISCAM